jgi:hypothetical protein
LEKRRQHSGLHCKSGQYSKGGPRLSEPERSVHRYNTYGGDYDQCRLLVAGAGLSRWRYLRSLGHDPHPRSSIHDLHYRRSRTVDDNNSQLVSLEISRAKSAREIPGWRTAEKVVRGEAILRMSKPLSKRRELGTRS